MNILVTGGAGYIGSHTTVELLNQGYNVVIADSFANSSEEVISRIEEITDKKVVCYNGDVADKDFLRRIFDEHTIDAVIHFAGLKAVGESATDPLLYYRVNIDTTLSLCEVMKEHEVYKLVFSSSATVYGIPQENPYKEDSHPAGQNITNPYGQTKYIIEQILRDLVASDKKWQITTLRYFNPIGAHPSGRIGEDPSGIPNNLMPFIAQVAVGRREKLKVFGDDYDTPDGTGRRDYIHVMDLATGHVAALKNMDQTGALQVYNLGTGEPVSVLELIKTFEKASGQKIPYEIVPRRAGDLPEYWADASKATRKLDWKTEKTLEEGCADTWKWQSQNPSGYAAK
jgi:UDP-glucose 4-epimerase